MYSRRRGSFHAKPTNHCRVAICDDRTPCVGFLARRCSRWREYLNAVGIFLFYSSSFSSLCTDPNLHHEDEVEAGGGRNNIICGEHEIPSFGPSGCFWPFSLSPLQAPSSSSSSLILIKPTMCMRGNQRHSLSSSWSCNQLLTSPPSSSSSAARSAIMNIMSCLGIEMRLARRNNFIQTRDN